jgi:K+-sensing histidine kinase KdpD
MKKIEELSNKSVLLTKNIKLISNLKDQEPRLIPMGLQASIRRSLDRALNLDPTRSVDVDFQAPDGTLVIMGEPLFDEIGFNIIHNAVKFQGPEACWIGIKIDKSEDGRAVVRISDKGPGIMDQFKKMIFDRTKFGFEHKHMGIGLALVKELVDRYGGKIWVEDRVEGKMREGSTFVIELPLA